MNRSYSKLRHLQNINIISENRYLGKKYLNEQDSKDVELLTSACKKWDSLPQETKIEWTNNTTSITNEDDPYDMDVACDSKDTKEAIQGKEVYRSVLKDLKDLKNY